MFEGKYIKQKYYNHITSEQDVNDILRSIFIKSNDAYKLQIAFGYVTETFSEKDIQTNINPPSQIYYFKAPKIIKIYSDLQTLLSELKAENIVNKLLLDMPDTKTKVIGIFSIAAKVIKLGYPIGAAVSLPEYIATSSRYINALADVNNNMCFFACCALMTGCRRDR